MGNYTQYADKYILRHAAGMYWLLDITQPGYPYKKPIPMNEVGAEIWQQLLQGKSTEEIVEFLKEEYGAEASELREDVEAFMKMLSQQGIKGDLE